MINTLGHFLIVIVIYNASLFYLHPVSGYSCDFFKIIVAFFLKDIEKSINLDLMPG